MISYFFLIVSIVAIVYVIKRYLNSHQLVKSYTFNPSNDCYNMEVILEQVKEAFNDILKTNLYEMNLRKEEFDKRLRNKNQLRKALKTCTYGDINAKNYIKDFIKDILLKKFQINEFNVDQIIPFNNPKQLSIQDQFDILLYTYKIHYGNHALEQLILLNHLDEAKALDNQSCYRIDEADVQEIYMREIKKVHNFQDKVNIIVQRVYQRYKGYGVIDEIRDMKIDGVSGGVSGIPTSFFQEVDYENKTLAGLPTSYDSVWIFFKGKTIHLSFLSFGSERELIRICKNIYRFNNPGQLSESNGYKVNEMKDGSRVVVARPPFCESWVFFVRKFDTVLGKRMEELITDRQNEIPIELIKWLIKGCRIIAITGQQGTGKTTLLMSAVQYINPAYTLRIQEMAFELHLRKLYPYRNIVTFRETNSITGQEGLDLQKKTDGTVNILGEVATAPVSSWMVQMSTVASLFTIFTHHAKTTATLVTSLRNALLQTGVFSNEKIAEKQVADVVNFDIHLEKDIRGHRYISRITEIIPLNQEIPYPTTFKDVSRWEEKLTCFMETMAEYFIRVTDRKIFKTKDIIIFRNGQYEYANGLSEIAIQAIQAHLSIKDADQFNQYVANNWGDAENVQSI
ncbi:ATPase, T2SS/T4P/T4SS family [Vallitalea okinawensis]|uniref:ATPase, T2SS/T4P/T4SS family n=1 Tax=Vallitalea okinawensis TaxID=2078660 RepID=UPI001A9A2E9D|nr:ATPase, T2SS/T4P/T4SS family [Vallitalea okinawensis]